MGEIQVKDRDIVVPGEVLASGMDYIPASGCFRDGEQVVATQIGLVAVENRLIKVIPLKSKYFPKKDDVVIGKVVDMTFSNWFVDIECANLAVLSNRDAGEYVERGVDLATLFSFNDVIVARILKASRAGIDLTMRGPGLRKLGAGRIIKVDPSKVPRIIGRQGSMISLIKDRTGCRIVVGQNGLVWIQGMPEYEFAAVAAVTKIAEESHKEGLTEEVEKLLASLIKTPPASASGPQASGEGSAANTGDHGVPEGDAFDKIPNHGD